MHRFSVVVLAVAGVAIQPVFAVPTTPDGKGFASPDAAAQALVAAAKANDPAAILEVLGPSAKNVVTTHDAVADRKIRQEFAARAAQKMRVAAVPGKPNMKKLLVGKDEWPLPFPIVQVNGQWYFDTAKGKEEIVSRRIGRNENDAIDISRGFVEAEHTYAELNRTGNNAPIYAQKIVSTPGKHDGLYWPATEGEDASPMGDLAAKAIAEGYTNKHEPFHGYYFKVLTGQGPHVPGGEMSYVDNGQMTKGFALIAWPSDYGSTGIMTFLVNKAGIVYQKNLGRKTAELASGYTAYDPDQTWTPVHEPSSTVASR
jgi:Protein of unknown function (DUF2950)